MASLVDGFSMCSYCDKYIFKGHIMHLSITFYGVYDTSRSYEVFHQNNDECVDDNFLKAIAHTIWDYIYNTIGCDIL